VKQEKCSGQASARAMTVTVEKMKRGDRYKIGRQAENARSRSQSAGNRTAAVVLIISSVRPEAKRGKE